MYQEDRHYSVAVHRGQHNSNILPKVDTNEVLNYESLLVTFMGKSESHKMSKCHYNIQYEKNKFYY